MANIVLVAPTCAVQSRSIHHSLFLSCFYSTTVALHSELHGLGLQFRRQVVYLSLEAEQIEDGSGQDNDTSV